MWILPSSGMPALRRPAHAALPGRLLRRLPAVAPFPLWRTEDLANWRVDPAATPRRRELLAREHPSLQRPGKAAPAPRIHAALSCAATNDDSDRLPAGTPSWQSSQAILRSALRLSAPRTGNRIGLIKRDRGFSLLMSAPMSPVQRAPSGNSTAMGSSATTARASDAAVSLGNSPRRRSSS